jgi:hypothetical protein
MAHYATDRHTRRNQIDGQKNAIEQRRRVHRLYFDDGYSKAEIARRLGLSKAFVVRWTESPTQDLAVDSRGWRRGQARRWDETTRRRIAGVHAALVSDPREFFIGATAIQHRYRQRYPDDPLPPLRTIGRWLKELGLSEPRQRPRAKGAARYLCYPEHTVYHTLGRRVLEVDFLRRHLTGRSAPLNFLGFSFKLVPKLRYFRRVQAESSATLIDSCEDFFHRFETPDVLKIDNTSVAIGTGSGKRCVSRFVHDLLNQHITPVFSVPRRPFSQASIEGNNSVFARKFWNTQTFTSVADVDHRLNWFNECSLNYTGYTPSAPAPGRPQPFVPRIYFMRQVREHPEHPAQGCIDILNELVDLPADYIQYFLLAEWNLRTERLHVHLERDNHAKRIKSQSFKLNPNSRYKPV